MIDKKQDDNSSSSDSDSGNSTPERFVIPETDSNNYSEKTEKD